MAKGNGDIQEEVSLDTPYPVKLIEKAFASRSEVYSSNDLLEE
jgi:hypothetical protein